MIERTLALIKPDATKQGGEVVASIVNQWLGRDLRIVNMKSLQIDEKLFEEMYGEHRGKWFYEDLREKMMAGLTLAFILEGEDAVAKVRYENGETDPSTARIGSIRQKYGVGVKSATNAVHGSATVKDADREIPLFFS